MKICARQFSHRVGFTMVEMLAAVAVIAILISLIIPALTMVKKSADMAKQRAQFHSIEIALEAFSTDDGDYPESDDTGLMPEAYPGAQKLAEAIIGQDGFGFHPRSELRRDGRADWDGDGNYTTNPDESVYHVDRDTEFETADENLRARRGPYLELENVNAVTLGNLYEVYSTLNPDGFVLCDMFGFAQNNATNKRAGMPILYYRANTSNFEHYPDPGPPPVYDDCIYDYRDNERIVDLTQLWSETVEHPMAGDSTIFYDNTLNPNFPPREDPYFPGRPYRAESFILLSAGPDGLYGTPDDVFNFNRNQ